MFGGQGFREAQQGEVAAAVAERVLPLRYVFVRADGGGDRALSGHADESYGVPRARGDDMARGEHPVGGEQHPGTEHLAVRRLDAGDPCRRA